MPIKNPGASPEHARPLWAPWRTEYIRKNKDDDRCFLCDNVTDDGREHELLIARGETAYLIMNASPYNSGHVLVAPNLQVADICQLTAGERAETMDLITNIKLVMDKVMQPDGYNFGFNLGATTGAGTEDHFHARLVPRWKGDTNVMSVLGNSRVVPETLDETAKLLRQAW